jgi:hypothetical protein
MIPTPPVTISKIPRSLMASLPTRAATILAVAFIWTVSLRRTIFSNAWLSAIAAEVSAPLSSPQGEGHMSLSNPLTSHIVVRMDVLGATGRFLGRTARRTRMLACAFRASLLLVVQCPAGSIPPGVSIVTARTLTYQWPISHHASVVRGMPFQLKQALRSDATSVFWLSSVAAGSRFSPANQRRVFMFKIQTLWILGTLILYPLVLVFCRCQTAISYVQLQMSSSG